MRRATERLGYPFVHAKAGREGAAQLNDNELRRIRNRLADIGPGETQVTGPDVDIELKEGGTVDFGAIQERDTRMLSTAIGIPLELLNEGSDGLGSGKPAEARLDMFALQNEAARRRFAAQFKSEFLVDIVREYSPFDHTQEFGIHIKPFLDDKTDVAELIQKVGDYMTANEVRSRLDMEPLEDDEKGEGFQTPADEEAPEDEGGGLFGSAPSDSRFRNLKVPDNAVSISDRSEAPEGAQVIEGDRGGLYYIPQGTDLSPEQADDIVKDKITDMDIDAVDETTRETALKKYERTATDNADRIKDPDVAIQTFDNIGEMFVNDFRTGINFSTGKENVDQASFEIQASARDSTFHHEFGHAIADAYGYGVSPDAAREGDLKYDSNEDNFVDIDLDRDDVDEFKLTKLEDGEAPEEVENLIEATNEAWEKMQQTSSEGGDVSDVVVRDNYGSISAHETLAQMHETMQTDVLPTSGHANFFDEHPNLTKAYVEVAEPAPRMKDLLSHLHNDRGEENSPFDSDPYPEREV